MDLLLKSILAAVLVALILVGLYVAIQRIVLNQPITKQQAITLILNDLKNSNPTFVNITNATPSVYPGSWHILASVVYNGTTPCPTYVIYSFDYPQYGFVYRSENLYTSNCVVYGLAMNRSYIIASAPVAIARSYNLSIPLVRNFVSEYGYGNVTVNAKFNSFYSTYTNIWIVNYTAPKVNYSVYVVLTQVGGIPVSNYTMHH
jgi:hypothetical protein